MKLLDTLYLLALYPLFALAAPPQFSVICDAQYSRDMKDILTQFSGFTNQATLDVYKNYMILLKLHGDLGYTLRPIENALTSDQRARLRTPLQHYVNCRATFSTALNLNIFDPSPSRAILAPCEQTYAIELQAALNYYAGLTNPTIVEDYQDYMVMLKRYQDASFKLKEFENRTPFDVFSRLRIPMRRYNNCKDAFIRGLGPAAAGSLRLGQ